MSNSDDTEPKIKFVKREPKLTPPGYEITLTVAQGISLAEMLEHPGWKVLKNVIVHQRKDHIARGALTLSQSNEQLGYYKGEVAELQLLVKTLPRLAKAAKEEDAKEHSDSD